jgi:hypothetical protein
VVILLFRVSVVGHVGGGELQMLLSDRCLAQANQVVVVIRSLVITCLHVTAHSKQEYGTSPKELLLRGR